MTDSDNWTPWSVDNGSLAAVPTYTTPSELRALGAAIGKYPYAGETEAAVYADHPRQAANDNYPRLVALTGLAGSGKSTATKYLVERHGYTLVKFAGPLKDMMRAIGFEEEEIEGEFKETPMEMLCGKTPRHAMQTLGTQWGRECIGEDFWIFMWRLRAAQVGGRVVVDDCRFPNEAKAIKELGGVIVKLEGRGGIAGAHSSEAGCGQHDVVVANDGSVVELYAAVEEEVRRWAA